METKEADRVEDKSSDSRKGTPVSSSPKPQISIRPPSKNPLGNNLTGRGPMAKNPKTKTPGATIKVNRVKRRVVLRPTDSARTPTKSITPTSIDPTNKAVNKTETKPPTSQARADKETLIKQEQEKDRLEKVQQSLKEQELKNQKSAEEAHALSEQRRINSLERSMEVRADLEDKQAKIAEIEQKKQQQETKESSTSQTTSQTASQTTSQTASQTTSQTASQTAGQAVESKDKSNKLETSSQAVEVDSSKTYKTRATGDQKRDSMEEEGISGKGSPRANKGATPQRRQGKITISQALSSSNEDLEEKTRSLAMIKRKREKERQKSRLALEQQEKVIREVIIPDVINVGELASRMAVRVGEVIKALINMGVKANSSSELDANTAELIVLEFEHKPRRVTERGVESILDEIPGMEESNQKLEARPPVVTVMGHVDHGKTSLLDALRKTRIQESEAGGITQSISAYQTTMTEDARKITFVDTPGHEAFSAMRARGANITDIVILLIAADSGIMPQTKEAISHAKAADVPIVVAINKIDLPDANVEKIHHQLLENDLLPEHLGGDVLCVPISAKTGEGLDDLLSSILLQAELQDCKSSKEGPAKGSVLEAYIDKGRGCIITLLVTSGTLKNGDVFVVGSTSGKVRAIYDDSGKKIKEAFPSQPVEIIGAASAPKAGDVFQVLPKSMENKAVAIAEYRKNQEQNKKLNRASHIESIDAMFDQFKEKSEHTLMIVVKADVQGMVEAIVSSFDSIVFDQYKIKVLHSGVGDVNNSDISLAATSGGIIVAFNVKTPPECQKLARQQKIDIINHSIIHHLIEEVEELLKKRKEPELSELLLGVAEVKNIFDMGKQGIVAGCFVINGKVTSSSKIIITRGEDDPVFEGAIRQLRRFRDSVQSVNSGYECGISCEGFEDFAIGDRIACYDQKTVQNT